MRINELFEPSADLQKHVEGNQIGYTFMIDQREFYVGFAGDDGDYYMSFTGQDKRGRQSAKLLGHNEPYRIFGNVIAAIKAFIDEYDPEQIEFDVDPDEIKRGRIYDRMLEAAERRGTIPDPYVWDRDGNHRYYIFKRGYR